jgi:hypothetical protein
MRRLYSTFAGGWPGTGLLLLRMVGGTILLLGARPGVTGAVLGPPALADVVATACGLLLIAGLWTPIVATLGVLVTTWQVLAGAADPLVALLVGSVAAALAMLGPGRWSVDARLFGWKRIVAPTHPSRAD